MKNKKLFNIDLLSWISFVLILGTGLLELLSPEGVFLSWGYVVGVLLTLISEKKRDIIIAALLSVVFISVSIVRIEDEAALRTIVLTRFYALVGLGFMGYFVMRYIKRDMIASNEKTLMAGIFLHGTQGIILTNEKGEIVMVNSFAEKLFGFEHNTLIGRNNNELIRQTPRIEPIIDQVPVLSKKRIAIHADGNEFPTDIRRRKTLNAKERIGNCKSTTGVFLLFSIARLAITVACRGWLCANASRRL